MCLLKINQTKYCTSKTKNTSVSYTLNDKNDNANTIQYMLQSTSKNRKLICQLFVTVKLHKMLRKGKERKKNICSMNYVSYLWVVLVYSQDKSPRKVNVFKIL